LLGDPIDRQLQAQTLRVRNLVGRDDHRTHWAGAVQRLALEPLERPVLEVARRDVVEDGVAKYVIESACLRDVQTPQSDDDPELNLPVQPCGQPLREWNRLAWADNSRWRFGEVDRRRWRWVSRLGGVRRIVLAKTDDVFYRPHDRRVALHAVGRIRQPCLGVLCQVVRGELGRKARA